MTRKMTGLAVAAVASLPAFSSASPGFWTTGTLPGYLESETSSNISLDGNTIAGEAWIEATTNFGGFRWTISGGMTDIGHFASAPNRASAEGVSPDGNTILGFAGTDPVKWTQSGGLVDLGYFADNSTALRSSSDGSVIVGTGGGSAFEWTLGGGYFTLPTISGYQYATPYDVSSDGTKICGLSANGSIGTAVMWVNGVLQLLPSWTLGNNEAYAMSADGQVVTGEGLSNNNNVRQAVLWSGGSVQAIGPDTSEGLGISPNGHYVVGFYNNGAFIWSAQHGFRPLNGDLGLAGIQLPTGWSLTGATGVTEDANGEVTVVGTGINASGHNEDFVARYTPNAVPEPGSLLALGAGVAALYRRRRSSTWARAGSPIGLL